GDSGGLEHRDNMRGTLLFLLAGVLISQAAGSSIFIADGTNGDDLNSGLHPGQAFRTIKQCVEHLSKPGDECQIRTGRYHESVNINGLRGTADKPIVIKGYGDEVPIWDGTVHIISSSWEMDSKSGICSTVIKDDIFALLLDDELLTAARWPNAHWSDRSVFNNTHWGKFNENSSYGHVIDDGQLGLAKSGVNATATMAILNIGSFITYVRPVTQHVPGTANFTYNHDMGETHWKPRYNQYFLEAGVSLLDVPGEWFYDKETKKLYVITPSGVCPDSKMSLRGRTIDYGLIITNSTGVTVSNISYIASNIHAYSVHYSDSHINDITLDSLKFKFPSSSRRMLGIYEQPNITNIIAISNQTGADPIYGKVSVINCTFIGSEGVPLNYGGKHCFIHNNMFIYNDWVAQTENHEGTVNGYGYYEEFSHNTMMYNGKSAGYRPGLKATSIFNRIIGQCDGKIQNDGAGIQVENAPQYGFNVSYNWIHNSPKSGIRFDGGGIHLGGNGTISYNVVWADGGVIVKGDNHTMANNIVFDKPKTSDFIKCSLCVYYRLRHDPVIENNNSVVINNAASQADGGHNVDEGGNWPLQGEIVENNYSGHDVKGHMVDPDNFDFRPVEGGPLANSSVIKGAYQSGLQSQIYWIPGQRMYKASTPIPPYGSTVTYMRDALMFLEAYMTDQHHIYFGTDEYAVKSADSKSKEFHHTLQQSNIFHLPKLSPNTKYFWRVDAQRGGNVYKGDTWSFNTK
ncbi:unnamed protein product, partial [Meganyctiphanes norvegica]